MLTPSGGRSAAPAQNGAYRVQGGDIWPALSETALARGYATLDHYTQRPATEQPR